MNDNIVILIIVLVAVNLVLIAVALVRAMLRRDRHRSSSPHDATARRPITNGDGSVNGAAAGVGATATGPTASRTDALTGLLVASEWNRIIADEDARVNRYGHPATVVIIELDGLDRLVAALGRPAGDRVLPALAD